MLRLDGTLKEGIREGLVGGLSAPESAPPAWFADSPGFRCYPPMPSPARGHTECFLVPALDPHPAGGRDNGRVSRVLRPPKKVRCDGPSVAKASPQHFAVPRGYGGPGASLGFPTDGGRAERVV